MTKSLAQTAEQIAAKGPFPRGHFQNYYRALIPCVGAEEARRLVRRAMAAQAEANAAPRTGGAIRC